MRSWWASNRIVTKWFRSLSKSFKWFNNSSIRSSRHRLWPSQDFNKASPRIHSAPSNNLLSYRLYQPTKIWRQSNTLHRQLFTLKEVSLSSSRLWCSIHSWIRRMITWIKILASQVSSQTPTNHSPPSKLPKVSNHWLPQTLLYQTSIRLLNQPRWSNSRNLNPMHSTNSRKLSLWTRIRHRLSPSK